ncbi:MAG: type II toxin-antitoxin system RelE/ParE family toxin [Actinomycetota bacterium]|nr:type II toxin-antitoxin system RelE/ParE family toxin [Actinomycetota bacterium]
MTSAWLLSAALADIESARQWYEAQRPGLGDEFVDAVDDAMESVLAFPIAYPDDYRGARRFLIQRFPYCLYYRLEDDNVVVVACLHAVRDPERKRRRLRG